MNEAQANQGTDLELVANYTDLKKQFAKLNRVV